MCLRTFSFLKKGIFSCLPFLLPVLSVRSSTLVKREFPRTTDTFQAIPEEKERNSDVTSSFSDFRPSEQSVILEPHGETKPVLANVPSFLGVGANGEKTRAPPREDPSEKAESFPLLSDIQSLPFFLPRGWERFSLRARKSVGDLGRGSYGSVYEVFIPVDKEGLWDAHLSKGKPSFLKEVALKVQEFPTKESLAAARSEAYVMELGLPGLVQLYVHTFSQKRGKFTSYMVMEKLEGGNLDELDYACPGRVPHTATLLWDPKLGVASLLLDLLPALHTLHSQGLVHRDVKPGNILLTRLPCVPQEKRQLLKASKRAGGDVFFKLADFGVACNRTDWEVGSTDPENSTGPVPACPKVADTGSLLYLGPEMWADSTPAQRQVSFHTDMWAFGLVLYQQVFGRKHWVQNRELIGNLYQYNKKTEKELEEELQSEFDTYWKSPDLVYVRDLLIGLLRRDPGKRLSADAAFKLIPVDIIEKVGKLREGAQEELIAF